MKISSRWIFISGPEGEVRATDVNFRVIRVWKVFKAVGPEDISKGMGVGIKKRAKGQWVLQGEERKEELAKEDLK